MLRRARIQVPLTQLHRDVYNSGFVLASIGGCMSPVRHSESHIWMDLSECAWSRGALRCVYGTLVFHCGRCHDS